MATKEAPVAKNGANTHVEVELVKLNEDGSAAKAESKENNDIAYHEPEKKALKPPSTDHIDCCKSDCCLYNDWNTLPKINPCCASPERPCCMKGESCMERLFEGIGVEIAKRPWLSMILSFIVIAACASGYAFVEDENRPDKLWIPTGSPALFHKEYVAEAWPSSQRFALYIATCGDVADGDECNILQTKYIEEMDRINREIKAITINTTYALEVAGVPADTEIPYGDIYTFEGDEDAGIEQLCFLLGSTGAVCGESSVLATFRNDIPADLTDENVIDTINFYPTQQGFCPLTISDPESPCRNATAFYSPAAADDCQVLEDPTIINNCRAAFNNYCGEKCPNWLELDAADREVNCTEESCTRSSWYLYRTETVPTFLAELSSMMSSGPDGPEVNAQGEVVAAEALLGYYMLATAPIVVSGSELDPIAEEWEKAALCKLGIVADPDDPNYNDETCTVENPVLVFTAQFQRSLGDEFGAEITGDIPLIGGSFGIIIVYLMIMLSRRDYVHSMIGMSIVCIITVGLSYAGCIGLGTYIGLKNNNLNLNIPFLLLGLGVDDAFVLSAEYFSSIHLYPTMSAQQRTVYTAKHGGVSILITSATDALAFLVGSSTALPALSWFCAFCGIGIIMCFVLQMFLFLPALQINHMRAEANYFDMWCCCKSKKRHDFDKPLGCCGCCRTEWCPPDVLSHLMGGFARGVTTVAGAVVSLLFFAGLLAAGIYGSTQLYKDFEIEWFVPEGSYLKSFYAQNDFYFQSGVSYTVYTKAIDYFDAQDSFVQLHHRMATDDYMDVDAGVTDWHHAFMTEMMDDPAKWPQMDCYTTLTGAAVAIDVNNSQTPDVVHCLFNNRTEFFQSLMEWYEVGGWNLLSSNVKWTDSTCDECAGLCAADANAPLCDYQLGINTSKVTGTLTTNSTDGGQQRYDTMTAVRAMVADCFPTYDADGNVVPFEEGVYNGDEPAFPYTFQFENWEEVGTIDDELWKNLGICFAVVVVIVFILIPKPRVAIFVILAIVMSIVDILGFLYFWDITISGVSTIFVLISVGLAVDYAAHIAHMFAESEGTARERAIGALARIGPSVFNAIFSTLLAVIVLATSSSYIYQVFFKVLCLTVLFAGAHGVWFLPVILGLAGGDNFPKAVDQATDANTDTDIEKADPDTAKPSAADHNDDDDDADPAAGKAEGSPVHRTSVTA